MKPEQRAERKRRGDLLRHVREMSGFTQQEFVDLLRTASKGKIDLHVTGLGRIEKGAKELPSLVSGVLDQLVEGGVLRSQDKVGVGEKERMLYLVFPGGESLITTTGVLDRLYEVGYNDELLLLMVLLAMRPTSPAARDMIVGALERLNGLVQQAYPEIDTDDEMAPSEAAASTRGEEFMTADDLARLVSELARLDGELVLSDIDEDLYPVQTLGERLRGYRTTVGLSQGGLGEVLYANQETGRRFINRLEAGKVSATLQQLTALQDFLQKKLEAAGMSVSLTKNIIDPQRAPDARTELNRAASVSKRTETLATKSTWPTALPLETFGTRVWRYRKFLRIRQAELAPAVRASRTSGQKVVVELEKDRRRPTAEESEGIRAFLQVRCDAREMGYTVSLTENIVDSELDPNAPLPSDDLDPTLDEASAAAYRRPEGESVILLGPASSSRGLADDLAGSLQEENGVAETRSETTADLEALNLDEANESGATEALGAPVDPVVLRFIGALVDRLRILPDALSVGDKNAVWARRLLDLLQRRSRGGRGLPGEVIAHLVRPLSVYIAAMEMADLSSASWYSAFALRQVVGTSLPPNKVEAARRLAGTVGTMLNASVVQPHDPAVQRVIAELHAAYVRLAYGPEEPLEVPSLATVLDPILVGRMAVAEKVRDLMAQGSLSVDDVATRVVAWRDETALPNQHVSVVRGMVLRVLLGEQLALHSVYEDLEAALGLGEQPGTLGLEYDEAVRGALTCLVDEERRTGSIGIDAVAEVAALIADVIVGQDAERNTAEDLVAAGRWFLDHALEERGGLLESSFATLESLVDPSVQRDAARVYLVLAATLHAAMSAARRRGVPVRQEIVDALVERGDHAVDHDGPLGPNDVRLNIGALAMVVEDAARADAARAVAGPAGDSQ